MNEMDASFADDYVNEFDLVHLEDTTGNGGGGGGGGGTGVKREDASPNGKTWNQNIDENGAIQPIRLKNMLPHWTVDDRKIHSMSPTSEQLYVHGPTHGQPVIFNTPGVPTTPPETPPVMGSPNSSYPYYPMHHRSQTGLSEEMMYLPQTLRGDQPLDLRHAQENDAWTDRKDYIQTTNGFQHHHLGHLEHLAPLNMHSVPHHHLHHSNRPHSVSSSGSTISPRIPNCYSSSNHSSNNPNGIDDLINDELLMTLTVRELNKRLHGCPRDQVVRLKQKRRTLKNRGYAQNCRSKRLQQRHDLEITNRNLHSEMQRIKMELARVQQERDQLKQRLQIRQTTVAPNPAGQQKDLHSDGTSSPEFYL